jgi:acetyl esterase/lipase
MKQPHLLLLATVLACSLVLAARAAEPEPTSASSTNAPLTVELWPDGTPTAMQPKSEATEKLFQSYGGHQPNRVTDVTKPAIRVYPSGKPDSPAVIVAPGGGFMFLSWVHEGTQVCEWLNTLGTTAVLLEYRTPTRDEPEMFTLPVEDVQRAMGLCRHRAREWGIDPKRVGILGFSAGANLAGHAAWDRGERTYPQDPNLDDPRGPDFLVFVYGGGFLDKADPGKFRPGFSVPPDAPPAFFVVAHDDGSNATEAAMLYLAYKRLELPAELHVFAKGGHGFGMMQRGQPIDQWPARVAEWLASMGLATIASE